MKKICSQNGEDGIITYIFDNIGLLIKSCEIGFHYNEANTLNLMKNNWNCLFIDCNNFQIQQFENIIKIFIQILMLYVNKLMLKI